MLLSEQRWLSWSVSSESIIATGPLSELSFVPNHDISGLFDSWRNCEFWHIVQLLINQYGQHVKIWSLNLGHCPYLTGCSTLILSVSLKVGISFIVCAILVYYFHSPQYVVVFCWQICSFLKDPSLYAGFKFIFHLENFTEVGRPHITFLSSRKTFVSNNHWISHTSFNSD